MDTAVTGNAGSATEKGNASWTVRAGLGSYIAANGGSNPFDSANAYSDDVSRLVSSPWATRPARRPRPPPG
ncbi:hypothetical protein [Amycolatopsis sp. lyj-346]|uniref:hypothetical protein n=1 Tax=Amycolatopsis sp. lyj-346 TaxID=2789289 RepID=UPI0039782F3D